MSIYIKGMEMPTTCEGCPCFYPEYNECNAIVGRWVDGKGTPPSDCPLIPVPEHGRLIDADALQVDMMEMVASGMYGEEDCIDAVIETPTIIHADKEGE